MDIAIHASDARCRQLNQQLLECDRLIRASSFNEWHQVVCLGEADVGVAVLSICELRHLSRSGAAIYPVPVVLVCSRLDGSCTLALRDLVQAGIAALVIERFDGEEALYERVIHVVQGALGRKLIAELEGSLQRLPPILRAAVHNSVSATIPLRSVRDLASRCGLSRSTLERAIRGAGFADPLRLVRVGTVLRFADLIRSGTSVEVASRRAGFADVRRAKEWTVRIFGTGRADRLRILGENELIAVARQWVLESPDGRSGRWSTNRSHSPRIAMPRSTAAISGGPTAI